MTWIFFLKNFRNGFFPFLFLLLFCENKSFMASTGPVPVTIFSNDIPKKASSKKTRSASAYKYISRIDGPGQYMRFAFFAESLEEGNSVLSELHNAKIIDSVFCHAYSRSRKDKSGFSIHGIAHITSRDYDFNFMRRKLPRASLRVSFYPEGTYPATKFSKKTTQTVQCLQEGSAPGFNTSNCEPNTCFGELPNESSFPSFN